MTITASRREWVETARGWEEQDKEPQACPVTSAADVVRCEFTSAVGGSYRAVATIRDAEGRTSRSVR
jgi:hypothetical protein